MDINSLINTQLICLELKAKTKKELFEEMAQMLDAAGKLSSKKNYLLDVYKREAIGNTGFEDGIAIPHAKSKAVNQPAVAVGISKTGIDYGDEDGQKSDIFFMIASPDRVDNDHIEVLVQISSKLIEDDFIKKIKQAKSKKEVLDLLTTKTCKTEPVQETKKISPVKEKSDFQRRMNKIKQHLLFGTSHMIPFIVAGGVLLSLSVMFLGKGAVPEAGVLKDIATMGLAGLTLFPVVLGGYISYSIADKPGLAPGMIGSWIAVQHYHSGFLGAIVVGFLAGFVISQLKRIKLPDSLTSLGAIFIYPLVGTFIVCGIVMWGIGNPIASMMLSMNEWLSSMAGSGKVVLGTILGAMTAFDMGGPVNKIATLFAQTQVDTQPWIMGGVGIAICTPPLGMFLATLLSPKKFKRDEREAGKAAGIMGLIGISEGAIPFAAADPIRVIPSIVAGGIVGNVVGFTFDVLNHAPWGGWIVLPVVEGKIAYVVGTLAGALTTAILVCIVKKTEIENEEQVTYKAESFDSLVTEGEAQILAITACPSGVAHTFLAAKSLENAGHKLGVKIKVETQGANGTINRLTAVDVANADFVILAHDVAIKDVERFANIRTIDVDTSNAMKNAEYLIRSNLAAKTANEQSVTS
jgi:fructose-specific PTS system IIC-like component